MGGSGLTYIYNGGKLDITGAVTITNRDITNYGIVAWEASAGNLTYQSGTFANNGVFDVLANATLAPNNSVGPVIINNGDVWVSVNGTATISPQNFSNAGRIYLDSGTFNIATTLDNTGTIYLQGNTLGVTGAGTELDNYGFITGAGAINAATLYNAGQIDLGIGAIGSLALNGDYVSWGGDIVLRLAGALAQNADVFTISGALDLTLGGDLTVTLINNYVPAAGDGPWNLIGWGTNQTGNFSNTDLPPNTTGAFVNSWYRLSR
jgi:hypothetical protein